MKKLLASILVLLFAVPVITVGAVTGQNSSETSEIFPGVSMTHVTTPRAQNTDSRI